MGFLLPLYTEQPASSVYSGTPSSSSSPPTSTYAPTLPPSTSNPCCPPPHSLQHPCCPQPSPPLPHPFSLAYIHLSQTKEGLASETIHLSPLILFTGHVQLIIKFIITVLKITLLQPFYNFIKSKSSLCHDCSPVLNEYSEGLTHTAIHNNFACSISGGSGSCASAAV